MPLPTDPLSINNYQRPVLQLPGNAKKLLLHTCCVVCGCEIFEALANADFAVTVYFYNPNIQPLAEYEKRRDTTREYAERLGFDFVDALYDHDEYTRIAEPLADEPERGKRCTACFNMRLQNTARYAKENGFDYIATTLGISRYKNLKLIDKIGHEVAEQNGVKYWDHNWRKQGGSMRMGELTQKHDLYAQTYCGCIYQMNALHN